MVVEVVLVLAVLLVAVIDLLRPRCPSSVVVRCCPSLSSLRRRPFVVVVVRPCPLVVCSCRCRRLFLLAGPPVRVRFPTWFAFTPFAGPCLILLLLLTVVVLVVLGVAIHRWLSPVVVVNVAGLLLSPGSPPSLLSSPHSC